ncbi:hypothetical protein MPSEU_001066800 [Mayamaea pseudoterrestris]|nr:hypothetical protein MPSEU_001066800 [Mayamaea pseudoterrestris]
MVTLTTAAFVTLPFNAIVVSAWVTSHARPSSSFDFALNTKTHHSRNSFSTAPLDCSRQLQTLKLRARSNEDDEDEEDDDDADDGYDEIPNVDVANFKASTMAYGLNSGRSSPSQRKAMGRSSSGTASIHVCSNCASEYVKWMGRCPTCKEWNTLEEQFVSRQADGMMQLGAMSGRPATSPMNGSFGRSSNNGNSWLDGTPGAGLNVPTRLLNVIHSSANTKSREQLQVPDDQELNNVLGGGIMPASLTLMGGEPGVGKSTLLLQLAGSIAAECAPLPGIGMGPITAAQTTQGPGPVWYISGEETQDQIASRAMRLGIEAPELYLLSETHADSLCHMVYQACAAGNDLNKLQQLDAEILQRQRPPSLLVIDSIQTMVCNAGGASAAGGITQVRECVSLFLRLAKSCMVPIVLVGHVTKSGGVAGPRTVEHMVDCVLYLEGPSNGGPMSTVRILRASKNRFGSSDEIGVYEMTRGRLLPVSDPSSLFLAHRATQEDMDGSATAIALEGRRAIAIEVQALVTAASGGSGFGRRTCDGVATSRLLLLLGVLQKRCGIFMSRQDVYINVVGRMRLDRGEGNAADLAVAVAIVSSLSNIAVRSDTAFVGEIGLLGELRAVGSLEKRVEEARRMGFSRVVTPKDGNFRKWPKKGIKSSIMSGVEWIQCDTLLDAINTGLVHVLLKKKRARKSIEQMEEIVDDEDDEFDSFM